MCSFVWGSKQQCGVAVRSCWVRVSEHFCMESLFYTLFLISTIAVSVCFLISLLFLVNSFYLSSESLPFLSHPKGWVEGSG